AFCWGNYINPTTPGQRCCIAEYPPPQCDPWVAGNGMFPGGGYKCKRTFASITDGSSNTYLVGESTFVPDMRMGADWAGTVGAGLHVASPPNTIGANANDWPNWLGTRSKHSGGVNMSFADGSVRFISNTIALSIHRALGTIDGGEVAADAQ